MADWYQGSIDVDNQGNVLNGRYGDRGSPSGGNRYISTPWGVPWFQTPINPNRKDGSRKTQEEIQQEARQQSINIFREMNRRVEEGVAEERAAETARQQQLIDKQRESNAQLLKQIEQQMRQEQEEANNAMAQQRHRANAAANPDRSAFGGLVQTLLGGREKGDNAGSQLFSEARKLGKKGHLGGKTLLSGE